MGSTFERGLNILVSEIYIWFELGIKSLPNLILATIVFTISIVIAKAVQRIADSLLRYTTQNRTVLGLIKRTLFLIVLAVGLFIALGILNLDKTVTSLLAGAGVVGLALGFALQDIATNFVSGILIALQAPYKEGDIVKVSDFFGVVSKVELRCTTVTTFDGIDVLVPNKTMYTAPLTNFTATPRRRLDIQVGISYSTDLRVVETITTSALEKLPGRIASEKVLFFYTSFGESAINFEVQTWIEYPCHNNYNRFRHLAIMTIKEAFEANGITIPFPIRTLDIPEKSQDQRLPLKMPVRNDG